jgi:hypothetical protein
MAIAVPKTSKKINDELIYFEEAYKGKNYHNIRKTYVDKTTGDTCLGKGLCVSDEDWEDIKSFFSEG